MSSIAERQKAYFRMLEEEKQRKIAEEKAKRSGNTSRSTLTANQLAATRRNIMEAQRRRMAKGNKNNTSSSTVGKLNKTTANVLKGPVNISGFCKALKFGAPRPKVEMNMRLKGLDPKLLDTCGKSNSTPSTASRKETRNIGVGTNNLLANTRTMSVSGKAKWELMRDANGDLYYYGKQSKTSTYNTPVGETVEDKNGHVWEAAENNEHGVFFYDAEDRTGNSKYPEQMKASVFNKPVVVPGSPIPPPSPPRGSNTTPKAPSGPFPLLPASPPSPSSAPPPPPPPPTPSSLTRNSPAYKQAAATIRKLNASPYPLTKNEEMVYQGAKAFVDSINNPPPPAFNPPPPPPPPSNESPTTQASLKRQAISNSRNAAARQKVSNKRASLLAQRAQPKTQGNNEPRIRSFLNELESSYNVLPYQKAATAKAMAQKNRKERISLRKSRLNENVNIQQNKRLANQIQEKRNARLQEIISSPDSKEKANELFTLLSQMTRKTEGLLVELEYNRKEKGKYAHIFYDSDKKIWRAHIRVGGGYLQVESADCTDLKQKIDIINAILDQIKRGSCGLPDQDTLLIDHINKCTGLVSRKERNAKEEANYVKRRNAALKEIQTRKNAREAKRRARYGALPGQEGYSRPGTVKSPENVLKNAMRQINQSGKNALGRQRAAINVLRTALPMIPNAQAKKNVTRKVIQYVKSGNTGTRKWYEFYKAKPKAVNVTNEEVTNFMKQAAPVNSGTAKARPVKFGKTTGSLPNTTFRVPRPPPSPSQANFNAALSQYQKLKAKFNRGQVLSNEEKKTMNNAEKIINVFEAMNPNK